MSKKADNDFFGINEELEYIDAQYFKKEDVQSAPKLKCDTNSQHDLVSPKHEDLNLIDSQYFSSSSTLDFSTKSLKVSPKIAKRRFTPSGFLKKRNEEGSSPEDVTVTQNTQKKVKPRREILSSEKKQNAAPGKMLLQSHEQLSSAEQESIQTEVSMINKRYASEQRSNLTTNEESMDNSNGIVAPINLPSSSDVVSADVSDQSQNNFSFNHTLSHKHEGMHKAVVSKVKPTASTEFLRRKTFNKNNVVSPQIPIADDVQSINTNENTQSQSAEKVSVEKKTGNQEKPTAKSSAEEFAEKYRAENKINQLFSNFRRPSKLDSQNKRIPDDLKFDIKYMLPDDVARFLHRLIIVDKHDIIAINKPYGLSCQPGPGTEGKSLVDLLPELQRRLKLPDPLHTVHRLDKETTGVLLLAKNPDLAHELREAFRKHEIFKSYFCVTRGVPDPAEGVINIPLKEVSVNSTYKMMLRPKYDDKYAHLMLTYGNKHSTPAVTYYNVLDQNATTALVECRPLTGVKHQVRAHMSQALNTPILGDHKYSHTTKLAPQILSMPTLKMLNVRQSKVRYLPIHLHAHCIALGPARRNMIPSVEKFESSSVNTGRQLPSLLVTAPFPAFFLKNLHMLRLTIPSHFAVLRSLIL